MDIDNTNISTIQFINGKNEQLILEDGLSNLLKFENNNFIQSSNFQENELTELKSIYKEGLGLLNHFEMELADPKWKFISKEESYISVWSKPFINPHYDNVIGSSLLSKSQIIDCEPETATLYATDWLARFSWDRYLDRFEIVYYFTTNDKQKAQKLNIPYSKYDILLLHMYTNMSLFVKSRDCVILQISGPHPTRKGAFFTVSRDYNEFIGQPKAKEYIRGGLPCFGYIFEPIKTYDINGIMSNGCFSTHICSFDFGNEGKSFSDYLLVPVIPKVSLMNLVYKIKFIRNALTHQSTVENYRSNQPGYIPNSNASLGADKPKFEFKHQTREEWINFFKDLDERSQWNSLPSKQNNICVFYDRHSSTSPLLIKTKYQVSYDPNSIGSFMFEQDFQWDPFIYHMILQDKITTLKGGGPVISSKFKFTIPFFSIRSELKNGLNNNGYFLLEQRENGDIFMFSFDNLKFKSDECVFTTYFLINPDNWRDKINPADLKPKNENNGGVGSASLDIFMLIKSSFSTGGSGTSQSTKDKNDTFDDPVLIKVIYLFSDIIDHIHSKVAKETSVLDSIKLLTVNDTILPHGDQFPSISTTATSQTDQSTTTNSAELKLISKKTSRPNSPSSSSLNISSSSLLSIPSDSFLQEIKDNNNGCISNNNANNNNSNNNSKNVSPSSTSSSISSIVDNEIDVEQFIKSKKKRNSISESTPIILSSPIVNNNNNNVKLTKSINGSGTSNNNLLKNSILLPPFIPSINSESNLFFSKNYKKQAEGDGMEITNLFYLPHEIIITVLSHLDHRALCKVSRTCKYMKQMSELDVLWYRLYVNIFGESNSSSTGSSSKSGANGKNSRKNRNHNNQNASGKQLRNLWDSYVKTQFQLFSVSDLNFDNPSLTFFLSKETNYETIDQQWKKNFFLKIRMEVLWEISKVYGQPKNTGPTINGIPSKGGNNKDSNANPRISLMSIASYRISPSQFAMIPNTGEGSITSIHLDGEKSYSGYSTGETYMIDFSNIKSCKPIKLNYTPTTASIVPISPNINNDNDNITGNGNGSSTISLPNTSSIHLWTQGDSLVYSGLANRKLIQYHTNNIGATKEIPIYNSKVPSEWSISGMSSNAIGDRIVVHYNSHSEESEFEDYDTLLDIFNADTGELQQSLLQDDQITAVHTHTNRVAVGGSRGPISLWDLNTGKKVISFLGHTDEVYSVKVLSKEDIVIASSKDGTVRFFDERTGPFYIKRIVDDIHVKSFDVEPKKILCGGGSRISYWDPRNLNSSIGELWGRPGSEITKVQLSQFNVAALFQHGSSNLWKFNV